MPFFGSIGGDGDTDVHLMPSGNQYTQHCCRTACLWFSHVFERTQARSLYRTGLCLKPVLWFRPLAVPFRLTLCRKTTRKAAIGNDCSQSRWFWIGVTLERVLVIKPKRESMSSTIQKRLGRSYFRPL